MPPKDDFSYRWEAGYSPSRGPYSLVPHDTVALPSVPKRLYVGTGGNVTLRGVEGKEDVVYKNVGNGSYLDVQPIFVRATGTSASDIVAEA